MARSTLAVVDMAKGDAGRFTYRALNARAEALGGWLRDVAGVQRGDRVGLVAYNGVEYLDVLFACGKLGAIFVPYNWRSHWRELVGLIHQTTPRVLLFSAEFAEAVSQLRRVCPASHARLHLDGDGGRGEPGLRHHPGRAAGCAGVAMPRSTPKTSCACCSPAAHRAPPRRPKSLTG